MKKAIWILLAFFILTGCSKDKYPSIDDLDVKIELVDDQGNITNHFIKGHDITFKYTVKNVSDKTFTYTGTPCPQEGFSVHDLHALDFLFRPVGNNFVCGDAQKAIEITPGETDTYVVVWSPDPSGVNLSGTYRVLFSSHISMLEGKEHRTYDLELDFVVR